MLIYMHCIPITKPYQRTYEHPTTMDMYSYYTVCAVCVETTSTQQVAYY